LMKHLSHFVGVGAKSVETTGTCDDAIGFVNPDGTVVLLLRNASPNAQRVEIQAGGSTVTAQLLADSMSTVTLKRA
jgi:glucosylceramidase